MLRVETLKTKFDDIKTFFHFSISDIYYSLDKHTKKLIFLFLILIIISNLTYVILLLKTFFFLNLGNENYFKFFIFLLFQIIITLLFFNNFNNDLDKYFKLLIFLFFIITLYISFLSEIFYIALVENIIYFFLSFSLLKLNLAIISSFFIFLAFFTSLPKEIIFLHSPIIVFSILLALFFRYLFFLIYKKSNIDFLTGLFNRFGGMNEIKRILDIALRGHIPISFFMFDIDHFKKVNDTYGHHVGDLVLKILGNLIKNYIRKSDVAIRWGGEEFLVVFLNCKCVDAYEIAEKFRKLVESYKFPDIKKITISGGVTEYIPNEDIKITLQRVDKLLYRAKNLGRNQIQSDCAKL